MRRLGLALLALGLSAAPAFAQAQGQLSQLPAMTGPLGGLVVECVSGCGSGGVGASVDISSVAGTVIAPGGSVPVVFGGSLPAGGNIIGAVNLAQYTPNVGRLPVLADINGLVAVTGTFFQPTQPISAVSLPLPTGAATESTLNTRLSSIETKLDALQTELNQKTEPANTQLVSSTVTTFPDNEPFNVAQYGGAATSLGQKTSAGSLPVVLANDALPAPDRSVVGTVNALNGIVNLLTYGGGTASLSVSGTWVGAFVFFGIDGNGQLVAIYGENLSTGASEASTSANGAWLIPSAGWTSVGVIATLWTSGTATVALIASPGSSVTALWKPLPAGANIIGGLLSNVAPGTTAPTNLDIVGGKTNDATPQYQPIPLSAGGAAVQVATFGGPGLPKPLCNALRRTNCQPKGF